MKSKFPYWRECATREVSFGGCVHTDYFSKSKNNSNKIKNKEADKQYTQAHSLVLAW